MRQILIGGAWPYANGSLHIGHIAGLLPGDVLARYHRAIGDKVYFVSGSDCHGTPVAIRAKQENKKHHKRSVIFITGSLQSVLKGWDSVMMPILKHQQMSIKIL